MTRQCHQLLHPLLLHLPLAVVATVRLMLPSGPRVLGKSRRERESVSPDRRLSVRKRRAVARREASLLASRLSLQPCTSSPRNNSGCGSDACVEGRGAANTTDAWERDAWSCEAVVRSLTASTCLQWRVGLQSIARMWSPRRLVYTSIPLDAV